MLLWFHRRNELVPLAYTDDIDAPKVAQIETVFEKLGRCRRPEPRRNQS